ncbi:MAG: M23 family metallopeptidase [Patescibacteria group bacterium]
MKKILSTFIIIIVIFLSTLLFKFIIGGSEDNWICVDGEWTRHGNPSAPPPSEGCGEEKIECTSHTPENCPTECVVCPPCLACSSITCQTEKFCEELGIDRSWYDNIVKKLDSFIAPLSQPRERVSLKKFGDYITPKNSPVQPEKFSGYHTGVDYEILPGEEDTEVIVRAVCAGTIKEKAYVSGYGGVATAECSLNDEEVLIIYGHLDLASIDYEAGDNLAAGEVIGVLGKGGSPETDGERKHLHLGIYKGNKINYIGYAASQEILASWIDPCLYFCGQEKIK